MSDEPLRRALRSLVGEPPATPNRAALARWRAGRAAGRRQALAGSALAAVVVAAVVAAVVPAGGRDALEPSRGVPSGLPVPTATAPPTASALPVPGPTPGTSRPSPGATGTYTAYAGRGLRVDVRTTSEFYDGATFVTFAVRVRDNDGGWRTVGVDFGDGHRHDDDGADRAPEGCPATDRDPPAGYAPRPVDTALTVEHAYRYAGAYEATVTVRTGRLCLRAPVETRTVRVPVAVGADATVANGPMPVDVEVWDDTASAGRALWLDVLTADPDGWVSQVDVDWGDGSEADSVTVPSDRCTEQKKGWASSRRTDSFRHTYARPGTYRVTVTAKSRGCSGLPWQSGTATATFAVPRP